MHSTTKTNTDFQERLSWLRSEHEALLVRSNRKVASTSGWYCRYADPVITADHIPLEWRFDLNHETNPRLLERLAVNAAFNAGAIYHDGKFCLVVRVEGVDRKSFFAVAESENGTDGFRFRDTPLVMPETSDPDTNVYDMRLTKHEDGWIYGVFCTERKDPDSAASDTSAAVAQCGLARTRDLSSWERLPDIRTPSPQQRNVVLHPELVGGRYAFYTRPQDGFISAGTGGGIAWGTCTDIHDPVILNETIVDDRKYHTIKESKNGAGPPPIKTPKGWLHMAHGVRNTAAGLRYVLYLLVTDLHAPDRVIAAPGGHFLAPQGSERVGDVSNVAFCNGWIERPDGGVLIYYASSDTRMHVAETSVDIMLDYAFNTPADSGRSAASVEQRLRLIDKNKGS